MSRHLNLLLQTLVFAILGLCPSPLAAQLSNKCPLPVYIQLTCEYNGCKRTVAIANCAGPTSDNDCQYVFAIPCCGYNQYGGVINGPCTRGGVGGDVVHEPADLQARVVLPACSGGFTSVTSISQSQPLNFKPAPLRLK
jgi:hypothetical protein